MSNGILKKYFALAFVLAGPVYAADYTPLNVVAQKETKADLSEVTILNVEDRDPHNPLYYHPIIVTVGVTAQASACEEMANVSIFGGQSGVENPLNPSDQYIKVLTRWKPDCATGSYGEPQKVSFPLTISYDDPTTRSGKQGSTHAYFNTQSISFDIGMQGGRNRYVLYTLNYKDPKKVTLTKVKTYSYVEGRVVDLD